MLPFNAKPIPGFDGYFATPQGEIWSVRKRRHQECTPHKNSKPTHAQAEDRP